VTFAINMDQEQAPRNFEPGLRSILFDTQHHVLLIVIVLHGIIWILRLSRFCQVYILSQSFWRALYMLPFVVCKCVMLNRHGFLSFHC